ncbi:MAG: hypothetical protein KAH20_13760 [Methylococcales bacterium]|nr:hypothetical protein [Methylococcales bacterium]
MIKNYKIPLKLFLAILFFTLTLLQIKPSHAENTIKNCKFKIGIATGIPSHPTASLGQSRAPLQ